MSPKGNNDPFLFVDKTQQLESLSRSNDDEVTTNNSQAKRRHDQQIRQHRTLAAPIVAPKPRDIPLLFINNNNQKSRSISRSKRHEASTINSHSQRWRNEQIRRHKQEALWSTSAAARRVASSGWRSTKPGPRSLPTPTDTQAPAEEDQHLTDAMRTQVGWTTLKPTRARSGREEDYQIIQTNFSEGDCIDPFSVTAIPINAQVQSILQYYLAMSIPATFKAENLPKDHLKSTFSYAHRHSPNVKEVVHGALFNKMHMYALLAATAGRMRFVSKVGLPKNNSAEVFMQKAIGCLRAYLVLWTDTVIDKQVVMDVFFLCVCEWYFQNYDAALMHLRAVGHLTRLLDLTSKFDQFIHETACYNDVFLAIETSTPPLFPLTWDVPPLTAVQWVQIHRELSDSKDYYSMGSGFANALFQRIFSPAMNAVVTEFMIWADMAQYTSITKTATGADAQWVSRKGQAMLHSLLSIPAISPEDVTVTPSRRREECCRLTLIILLSYIATQMAWRSGKMNMVRLQKVLWTVDRSWGSGPLDRILLWVLMCGAFAAEGTPDEEWFLSRALQVARKLDVGGYESVRGTMGQFFYASKLQDRSMRKLAERILDGKRKLPNSRKRQTPKQRIA